MPTDQTPYFKARAKTITQRLGQNKSKALLEGSLSPSLGYKKLVLVASNTGRDIAELSQLVLSHRRDYLAFNAPTGMSVIDRDQFDRDCEKALTHLGSAIRGLSLRIIQEHLDSMDEKKHLSLVVDFLDVHFKKIANMITDMRKLRLRNSANRQKVCRLSNMVEAVRRREQVAGSDQLFSLGENQGFRKRKNVANKGFSSQDDDRGSLKLKDSHARRNTTFKPGWEELTDLNSAVVNEVHEVHLSSQEKTQMIAENQKIFEKFAHVNSEIENLEAQIAEIQKLQETFAEKIMDQDRDIDVISEAAIQTTENLRDGNEWIRQAISNSAGRRVVVLFCIIVITFTLLFLDWYNI